MRFFKVCLYLAAVIILQTVFFPRLGFFGVSPDLILVSVIALAVLAERTPATLFAAAAAFIQDLLLAGCFFHNTV